MRKHDKGSRTNFVRRGLGVLLFLLPFGLIASSLSGRLFSVNMGHILFIEASVALMGMALLLSSLNLYLAYIRPARFGHRPDYRNVSGIPLIGTLLVIAGTVVGWSSVVPALLGLVALLLDTGGLPWFIVGTWCDRSFWDS